MGLTETEKRLQITDDIAHRVSLYCDGVLLGGSVAFGNATESSDIDVMFLVKPEQARNFVNALDFKEKLSGRALDSMNIFGLGCVWAKEVVDGIDVNCFLYNTKSLEDYLTIKKPLDIWRKDEPRTEVPVHTFDGARLTIQRKVNPMWNGYGYVMPVLAQNGFYTGAIRSQFLGAGRIMCENGGTLTDLEAKTWRATMAQLVKVHRPVDLTKRNVLNTLYAFHSKKLPQDWAERVQERTRKELADYFSKE